MLKRISTFAMALLFTTTMFAANNPTSSSVSQKSVNNYLTGLASENTGLSASSAFHLGEFQTEEAVIPLMKVLKSDSSEELKIMAALSLYKIKDGKGLFAVGQASKFDDSKRVRNICSKLYNKFLVEQTKSI